MSHFKNILTFVKYCSINFVLFTIILSLKRHFSPGILFHEGILALIITTFIMLLYIWESSIDSLNKIHKNYMIIISFFLILTFHTTVITIVDRSISVFIINNIRYGVDDPVLVRENFIKNFTTKGIDKRIQEQRESGNIKFVKGDLHLTWKGELYYQIFKSIQIVYNTDKTIFN